MSSPTKILDNAVIGYCIGQRLQSDNTRHQRKDRALIKRAKELGIWDAIRAEVEGKLKGTGTGRP
jgi:hypothetical protein